jgi:DNA-binding MarR family transcriptional regulator
MTAAELCEQCDEDKAAISRSLFYLEENGFLTREVSIPNRRARGSAKHYRAALTLTEKGEDVARHIAERIDCVLEQVSCGVSDADRAILYRVLEQIDRNLLQMCEHNDDED